MTSTAKTGITADVSGLVDLTAAGAADVLNPVTDLLNHAKSGRVGVTAADTHVKHLDDGFVAGVGIAKAILNPGANEQIQVSAGPGGYRLLASGAVVGSPVTAVTLSAIPATYKTLRLVAGMGAAGLAEALKIIFNADTSGNDYKYAVNGTDINQNAFGTFFAQSDGANDLRVRDALPTGAFAILDLHIHRYATSGLKYVQGHVTVYENGGTDFWPRMTIDGTYAGASAISEIQLASITASNIAVGSWYELYGIG